MDDRVTHTHVWGNLLGFTLALRNLAQFTYDLLLHWAQLDPLSLTRGGSARGYTRSRYVVRRR